jgi:D-alanine-D-alanine ligase
VDTPAAFRAARLEAARYDACVLAERLIDGPEYTVAILGDRALPAIRIEAAREFYDYAAKYEAGTTRYHIPCGLDEDDARALGELALQAFAALGCSVWGRVDVMRDSSGAFQLLEVNTVPGMTASSLVPMAARAAGLTLLELLEEIMLRSWEAGCSASGVKG